MSSFVRQPEHCNPKFQRRLLAVRQSKKKRYYKLAMSRVLDDQLLQKHPR
jgi:hypothetical protein